MMAASAIFKGLERRSLTLHSLHNSKNYSGLPFKQAEPVLAMVLGSITSSKGNKWYGVWELPFLSFQQKEFIYLFIYYRFITRSKSYVMAQGLVFIKKKPDAYHEFWITASK